MFPASRRSRSGREQQEELNITPIMNVFMILVPFLLLCAAFTHVSMVDLSLPVSADPAQEEEETVELSLRVSITEAGLRVEGNAASLVLLPPLPSGELDFEGLARQLAQVHKSFPDERAVVVAAAPAVRYQPIVSVMDRCKAAGFSEISVGPAESEGSQ